MPRCEKVGASGEGHGHDLSHRNATHLKGLEGLMPASTGGLRKLGAKLSLLAAVGLASCAVKPAMASRCSSVGLVLKLLVVNDCLLGWMLV